MGAAVAGLLLGALLTPGHRVWADPTVGQVEITAPGQQAALHSGGSSTPFGLVLPAGARCLGDTAHRGYHVFSYLVPLNVSPATIRFTNVPDRGLGLFAAGGVYVGAVNTAEYTGQIIDIPDDLTMARLSPSLLFAKQSSATWNAGLACVSAQGVVSSYWNTRIRFSSSSADPRGFTWTVPSPVHLATGGGSVGIWLAVILIAAAIVFAGVAFRLRRRVTTEAG